MFEIIGFFLLLLLWCVVSCVYAMFCSHNEWLWLKDGKFSMSRLAISFPFLVMFMFVMWIVSRK